MLNKQAFLNIKSQVKKVEVPEWNDHVYVKKFSAAERIAFLRNMAKSEETDNRFESSANTISEMVKVLLLCISDENGARVFEECEEDYQILAALDNKAIEMLFNEAIDFNGLGGEKEAIKNSDSSQN
jgi:hypothetical protein